MNILIIIKPNETSWETLRRLFLASYGIPVPPLEPDDFDTDKNYNKGAECRGDLMGIVRP